PFRSVTYCWRNLAGVIIGPSLVGLGPDSSDIINIFAEIGVMFLLFSVGLETKPQAILAVGKRAFIVAVLGVVIPFRRRIFDCSLVGRLDGRGDVYRRGTRRNYQSGLRRGFWVRLDLLHAPTAKIILGAAVIDDVLGLLILSVVSSFSKGGVDYYELAKTAGLAVFFTLFVVFVGARLVTRLAPKIEKLHVSKPFFNAGLILCLGLSLAASYIGVAAIIGAFLAGMTLAEATEDNRKMHKLTSGVTEFLVPFFLVNIGMQLDLKIFQDASAILLALIVTIVAVLTKFVACGLGAYDLGWRRSAQVGIGMVPRGEVGIVVAQIGLGLAVISPAFFAAVLFMAVATTLIAPPFYQDTVCRR
ncbi:MAG: cation:proton antiporter, partial [Hymenobacter sp.]